MKIKIEPATKYGKYRADILDLPGSPWCGYGDTKEAAVANCFLGNLAVECYQPILIAMAKVPESYQIEILEPETSEKV